jgi:hypothetical protein
MSAQAPFACSLPNVAVNEIVSFCLRIKYCKSIDALLHEDTSNGPDTRDRYPEQLRLAHA